MICVCHRMAETPIMALLDHVHEWSIKDRYATDFARILVYEEHFFYKTA